MNTRKRFIIDGIVLFILTIIVLCSISGCLIKQIMQMEEHESNLEDKQFFMKSSFAGTVLSKSYERDRDLIPSMKLKLYRFEKLRYNYSWLYDFTSIKDSIATLYLNKELFNRIQTGDTIEKEMDSLSIKVNKITCEFYK